jgi:hypothetical protein
MPIRGHLKAALALSDFHDSVQSGFLDQFDFRKSAEKAATLRNDSTVAFQVSNCSLGTSDRRAIGVGAIFHAPLDTRE